MKSGISIITFITLALFQPAFAKRDFEETKRLVDEAFADSIGDVDEKLLSPAQMKPHLKYLRKVCLENREAFVRKYTAVGEDPAATCDCVVRAVATQKKASVAKAGVSHFASREEHAAETIAEEFVHHAEENCRVEPKWVVGTFQPADFDRKWLEIQERMKYRRLPDALKKKYESPEKAPEKAPAPPVGR